MLYTLTTTRPVKVADGVDQAPLLVINRDLTNQVVYGDQTITNLNQNTLAIVDPLGSVALDGTSDVWLLAVSGTPTVDVVPGGQQWSPSPASIAAQIQAIGLATAANQASQITQGGTVITNTGSTVTNTGQTATNVAGLTIGGNPGGVPLLRDTNNLGNATGQTLSANATTTLLNSLAVSQPSYEAIFQLNTPASSGTIPFAVINIVWKDSFTGLTVGQKSFVLPAGNGPSNVITAYLSGPCRGNQITVTIANRDPSVTFTLTYAFNLTSHVYLIDRFLQPIYPANPPNGQTQGGGNPAKGLLFASSPTVGAGAGTTVTRMTAASNLKCKFSLDLGGAPNALNVTLSTPSSTPLYDEPAAGEVLYRINGTTGAGTTLELQMPNGPLNVNMINQGAAAVNPNVTITAMEY